MIESERERTSAAPRQVEDLNRQRESITSLTSTSCATCWGTTRTAPRSRAGRREPRPAFQEEQKKSSSEAKDTGTGAGTPEKSTKPARPPARPAKSRPAPVSAAAAAPAAAAPDVPAQSGPSEDGSPDQVTAEVKSEASADSESHDEQTAGKDDAPAPTR